MSTIPSIDTKRHALRVTGDQAIACGPIDAARLAKGFTLEAWVRPDPVAEGAVLYPEARLGGTGQVFRPGRFDDLGQLRVGTDAVSARVPDGYWLVLFQEPGCRGPSRTLRDDVADLGADWAGKVKSCAVLDARGRRQTLALIYGEPDFKGRAWAVDLGRVEDLQALLGDARVRSVAVPPGLEIALYAQPGCVGDRAGFEGEDGLVAGAPDPARSLVLAPALGPKVDMPTLYPSPAFGGAPVPLAADVPLALPVPGARAGTPPSLRVPEGWRVRLYGAADGKGSTTPVHASQTALGPDVVAGARSVRIARTAGDRPAGVALFAQPGHQGAAWELPFGRYADLRPFGAFRSLAVWPGHRVVVYDKRDFGGTARRLDADVADLADAAVGSLEVVREERVLAAPSGFGLHLDVVPPDHAVQAQAIAFGGAPLQAGRWSHVALAVAGRAWTWFVNGREVKREDRDPPDLGGDWRIGEGFRGDIGGIVARAGARDAKALAAGRFAQADKADGKLVRAWPMEAGDGPATELVTGGTLPLPAGEAFWVRATLPRSPLATGLGQHLLSRADQHGQAQIQAARAESHTRVSQAQQKAALRVAAASHAGSARAAAARIDAIHWLQGGRPARVDGRGAVVRPDEMCWWFEQSVPCRMQFFDDDRRLLVVHENGTAVVWRVDALAEEHRFKVPDANNVWCFDQGGWKLFSHGGRGKWLYYDLAARKPLDAFGIVDDDGWRPLVFRAGGWHNKWMAAFLKRTREDDGRVEKLTLQVIDAFSGSHMGPPATHTYQNDGTGVSVDLKEGSPLVIGRLFWDTPLFALSADLRTAWLSGNKESAQWIAVWDLERGSARFEQTGGGVPFDQVAGGRAVHRAELDDGTGSHVKQVALLEERRVVKVLDPRWGVLGMGMATSQPVSVGPGSSRVVWIREPHDRWQPPSPLAWADAATGERLPGFGPEFERVAAVALSGDGRLVATFEYLRGGYQVLRVRGTPLNRERSDACYALDAVQDPESGTTYVALRAPWPGIARVAPYEVREVRRRDRAVHALALDLADADHKRVFWIEAPGAVCAAPLAGGADASVVVPDLIPGPEGIWDLAFDAEARRLLWTNGREVWCADVAPDGKAGSARVLVPHGASPGPIAVDADDGKVYWVDRVLGEVRRADGGGGGLQTLYAAPDPRAALAIDGDRLYWCAGHTRPVEAAILDDPGLICHLEDPAGPPRPAGSHGSPGLAGIADRSGQRVAALEDTALHAAAWGKAGKPAADPFDVAYVCARGNDYLYVDKGIDFKGACTLEGWIRVNPTQSVRLRLRGQPSDALAPSWEAEIGWRAGWGSNVARYRRADQMQDHYLTCPPIGTWVHLAAVVSEATAAFFVDGKPVGESPSQRPPPGKLELGLDFDTDGRLGALRVWDRPLSAADVAALAAAPGAPPAAGDGPVFEASPQTLTDATTRTLHAPSPNPDERWRWRKPEPAPKPAVPLPPARRVLALDGQDGHVDLGPLFLDASRGFALEAVVRCTGVKAHQRIVDLGNGRERDNIVVGRDGTSDRLCVETWYGPGQSRRIAGGTWPLWGWVHVVAAMDAAGAGRIYLNGQKVAEGALLVPRSVLRTQCFVGRNNWADLGAFEGEIALLKLWNHDLSDEEVAARFADPFRPEAVPARAHHRSLLHHSDGVTYLMSGDRDGLGPAVPLFPLATDGPIALQSRSLAAHEKLVQAQRARAEAQAKADAERFAAARAAHEKLTAAHAAHDQALADAQARLAQGSADADRQREDAHRRLTAAAADAARREAQARADAHAQREQARSAAEQKKRAAADDKQRRIREAQQRLDDAKKERQRH
ncbi:hypothetical protein DCC79_02160 [bacterium]|nr:MAG: hypothetical protein DCC79_02160 [bacterium]